jgi:hypothetical protein
MPPVPWLAASDRATSNTAMAAGKTPATLRGRLPVVRLFILLRFTDTSPENNRISPARSGFLGWRRAGAGIP